MIKSTDEILAERQSTHGEFADHAQVTQAIKDAMMHGPKWDELPDIMKESLAMLAHKIGRIVTGNPFVADHWADTAGYARLVEQRIEDKKGLLPQYDIGRDRNFGEAQGNPFEQDSFNLTAQGELLKRAPSLARRLQETAKNPTPPPLRQVTMLDPYQELANRWGLDRDEAEDTVRLALMDYILGEHEVAGDTDGKPGVAD